MSNAHEGGGGGGGGGGEVFQIIPTFHKLHRKHWEGISSKIFSSPLLHNTNIMTLEKKPYEDINTLQNDKFIDWSKLKAFADDQIIIITEKFKSVLGGVENRVRKGENADFLLLPPCFQKASYKWSLKVRIVW